VNFQSQNHYQAYQNQNLNNQAMNNQAMNNQAMSNQAMSNQAMSNQAMNNQMNNQALRNQALGNQAQLQNEASIAARGYNPQQDLELAADMNQKTTGEIQRILASKAVTGIEFGYIPFPESGPNQMNNQNTLNTQYHNANAEMKIAQR
jgi:hypothetical protein